MLHAVPGLHWPIDLRRNTCLSSLHIEFDGALDITSLVTQLLSQTSSAHMEEVGLDISAGDGDQVGQLDWNAIDAALQHSSFSGLRTVTVRVVQWPFVFEWDPNAFSWIKDRMPGCHARGILRVRSVVEWQFSYFLP
jgi:hypothetical protein